MYSKTIKKIAEELIRRNLNNGKNIKELEEIILQFLEEKDSFDLLSNSLSQRFLVNEIDIILNEKQEV